MQVEFYIPHPDQVLHIKLLLLHCLQHMADPGSLTALYTEIIQKVVITLLSNSLNHKNALLRCKSDKTASNGWYKATDMSLIL